MSESNDVQEIQALRQKCAQLESELNTVKKAMRAVGLIVGTTEMYGKPINEIVEFAKQNGLPAQARQG